MGRFSVKKFGRRIGRGLAKGRKILRKGARTAKTILGTVDKLSGGAATRALSAHPYGKAALAATHLAAQ